MTPSTMRCPANASCSTPVPAEWRLRVMIGHGGRVSARDEQSKALLTHPRRQSLRRAELQWEKANREVHQFPNTVSGRNAGVKQLEGLVASGLAFDTLC